MLEGFWRVVAQGLWEVQGVLVALDTVRGSTVCSPTRRWSCTVPWRA